MAADGPKGNTVELDVRNRFATLLGSEERRNQDQAQDMDKGASCNQEHPSAGLGRSQPEELASEMA